MHRGHATQLRNLEVALAEKLGRPVTPEEVREAYRAEMKARRSLRTNYDNPGGFKTLKDDGNNDRLKEISRQGVIARQTKRRTNGSTN